MTNESESELLFLDIVEDYLLCEQSLSHFIRSAWDLLEPGVEYLHNWHIDYMCEYLEAVTHGEIKKLIINMPYRHMKSICASVCWPVWTWTQDPTRQFMCASYSDRLSNKLSRDRRFLIQSQWYQSAWSNLFRLTEDDNQVQKFSNDRRGHMVATSVGGTSTGEGGHILLRDDPINPKQAYSETIRNGANVWGDQTWSTRKNSKDAADVIVMQRLHVDDPSGHELAKDLGYEHVKIPLYAEKKIIVDFLSGRKITRKANTMLQDERFDLDYLKDQKKNLGPFGYAAQGQQDPMIMDGGLFKRRYWKWIDTIPMDTIKVRQYWDTANVPGVGNDFSVCATWVETPTSYICVDIWREQVAFPQLVEACRSLYMKGVTLSNGERVMPDKIMIEQKASGVQLFQELQNDKMPTEGFNPLGSKLQRAAQSGGAQTMAASGNLYLLKTGVWCEDFIQEHESFPNGAHDDMVDTTSMAITDFKDLDDDDTVRIIC